MTSEVLIMNKSAIALAADSAVTVSSNRTSENKYLKGANKLFELSDHHPVAIMIYNSAAISGVPWELVIKDFRASQGNASHPKLQDYDVSLRVHVESRSGVLPFMDAKENFCSICKNFLGGILDGFEQNDVVKLNDASSDPMRRSLIAQLIDEVNVVSFNAVFDSSYVENVINNPPSGLIDFCNEISVAYPAYSSSELIYLSISFVLKKYEEFYNYTGLVIAGYGDSEYFPAYCESKCYGFIYDKLVFVENKNESVTNYNPSIIRPFAQSSMSYTFMFGLSMDVHFTLKQIIKECLIESQGSISPHLTDTSVDLTHEFDNCLKAVERKLIDSCRSTHYDPLSQAVGFLPIDEMARLAETLISLESIKEKVTRPSESVGGPVDVAIITKSEGVVWVKRKLYFPSDLNSKYLNRQQNRLS